MITLLPQITPTNEKDQLASFFNIYIDKLDNLVMLAMPQDTMQEYVFGPNKDPRRAERTYETILLGRSLSGMHWSAFQALEQLTALFDTHGGDPKAFAIANRLESLEACGSDDDTDWYKENPADENSQWLVVHKEDNESLAPYTIHAALADFFPGGEIRGEAIGTSSPDAFASFNNLIVNRTDFSFRKMWGQFTGNAPEVCRVDDEGAAVPVPLGDQIEEEMNEDINNKAFVEAFDNVIGAFRSMAAVYARACRAEDYRCLYVSLTSLLYGPDAVKDLPSMN